MFYSGRSAATHSAPLYLLGLNPGGSPERQAAETTNAHIEQFHAERGDWSTDNAGLAMARAVSVVHVMRADPRLARAAILPMSDAQMIVPVDRIADGSDQQRRRIEIRLRRSTTEAVSTAVPR